MGRNKPRPDSRRRDDKGKPERIQKVLATAGIASRRKVEELIRDGRIKVNEKPASIGQAIGPRDRVRIDGRLVSIKRDDEVRVLAYKKQVGEVVTRADPDGRKTVFRKLPKLRGGRWIAIGRLDLNTSGLLLLTNSGELARRLMHPSFELEREYAVRVLGDVDDELLKRLHQGVELEDGEASFVRVWRSGPQPGEDTKVAANQWFNVVVREGRNRLVRRVWESQGLKVSRLIRVRYGPIELGRGIKSAGWRELGPDEVQRLMQAVKFSS